MLSSLALVTLMRTPSNRTMKAISAVALLAAGLAPFIYASIVPAQDPEIPAEFTSKDVSDPVSKVLEGLSTGTLKLTYEPKHGYLKSLLKELRISPASQILVFSKTSLQSRFISPNNPRAIYFNEHAYVAWIPGAPLIELVGIDPKAGPTFFVVHNKIDSKPDPIRQTMECFQCHYSPISGQVPGLMARSVFAGPDGRMRLAGGSYKTTSKSPIAERWGGWYVSGRHGSQRHMGNEVARGDDQAPVIDFEKGANVTDLGHYFNTGAYLSPHSDIVALLVFEQQKSIQNLITRAGFLTRRALRDAAELLKLEFGADHVAEETNERIKNACEPVVLALLGAEEPKLTAPIQGTGGFASYYSATAPPDKVGRRLSELNLKTRILRYPCSPMIYSEAFGGLPVEAKAQVLKRLVAVLSGQDPLKGPIALNPEDGKAALEILRATLPASSFGLLKAR